MNDPVPSLLALACLLAPAAFSSAPHPTALAAPGEPRTPPDWPAILEPPEAPPEWPEPRDAVVWEEGFERARARAVESGRPLFVTMRCLPCKQCSAFDQEVLEGGPRLDPLLRQFETVRLTDAGQIDLRVFPMEGFQDYDLSWWGWLLSPDLRIYGIFGGKDHVSDASRVSVAALEHTLRRVLDHHYDPRRESWNVDGPAADRSGSRSTPRNLPGFASWVRRRPDALKPDACLHCHQVGEISRQPAIDAGTLDKARDLAVWPYPENVGLVLDRDDGLLVKRVVPGSPAERAGLRALDVLAVAEDRLLFGQADFRGVLHRGPRGDGTVSVWWLRGGRPVQGTLGLKDGWRATPLAWRMSISQGNIGARPGFWPLGLKDGERRRFGIPSGVMAIKPWYGKNPSGPAYEAGLTPGRAVVAIDGLRPPLFGRELLAWFRLRYEPGDLVEYTVREQGGGERRIRFAAMRGPD